MKKIVRILLKIILAGVVVLAAGLLTLRLMFPPEKIKRLTLDYAKNTLHREVSFDSVSFNIIGLTLNNFALSEDNSFEQGTFIQAQRLEAKVALWPLLKKRIEISTIALEGISLNLVKQKDGSFNFSSLMTDSSAAATTDEKTQKENSSSFAFTAQRITALDCDINYQDLSTGFSSRLEDLNIRLSEFDMSKPFSAGISFTSHTQETDGPAVSVPVNIVLKVSLADMDLAQAYVEIAKAQATYKNIELTLQGKVQNLQNPQISITGTLSGLDHTTFVDFLPDLPHFTLPPVQVVLEASADLQASSAQIQTAALKIQNSHFTTNGSTSWAGENVSYRFNGTVQADMGQIVKMTDTLDFAPKGLLTGSFAATDKKEGKDISGSLTLKDVSVLYPPFSITQMNGTVKMASLEDISCPSLSGLLNDEKFKASFAYKNIKEVLDLTLKLDLAKLTLKQMPSFGEDTAADSAQAAPAQTEQTPPTLFNVTADVNLGPIDIPHVRTEGLAVKAALQNVSESMQQTNGTLSFTLQPGAVTDMDKLLKQNKIVRIILLPLGLLNTVGQKLNLHLFDAEKQAKKGEIAITKGEGRYTFTNGLMKIDATTFESTLTNINANGTIDFATDKKLDMKASATLLTKQTPVVIKITGTVDNPSGKLDVLNTVGSVVGGILSYKTAKSAATGTATAAGDIATGAVKTTGQAAQTTAKETADAAKATVKALGSLFKKKKETE